MTTAAQAPAAKTQTRTTDYVILKFNADSDEWAENGDTVRATNRDTAVRKHVDSLAQKAPGVYVAVPKGSFQPVTVTSEIQTTIKLAK